MGERKRVKGKGKGKGVLIHSTKMLFPSLTTSINQLPPLFLSPHSSLCSFVRRFPLIHHSSLLASFVQSQFPFPSLPHLSLLSISLSLPSLLTPHYVRQSQVDKIKTNKT